MTKLTYFVYGAIASPIAIIAGAELLGRLHVYGQGTTGLGRLLCFW